MDLVWIDADADPQALPHPDRALRHPNGLLAAGGRLDRDWLLHAYRHGIFPWFGPDDPILWWSPDPRAVLRVGTLRVSRSLRKTVARAPFELTADTAFTRVIRGCGEPRSSGHGTWITASMREAYAQLHREGWAHSFEAWQDGRLVGGLYGVCIGRVFFGESMFTRSRDASKVAFVAAMSFLARMDIELVDCQVPSAHLTSLGAVELPRTDFLAELARLTQYTDAPGSWSMQFAALQRSASP